MALGISLGGGGGLNEGDFCLDLKAIRVSESGRADAIGMDEEAGVSAEGMPAFAHSMVVSYWSVIGRRVHATRSFVS